MRKLLLLLAISFCGIASAQTIESPNITAQKEMAKKGYFGNVTYKLDQVHSINVNYSIMPKVPKDKVEIFLHTPEARPIGMYVTNLQGKKLLTFKPNKEEYIKEGELDVSSLKAGKYIYVINWENDTVIEIPFEKK